jgi:hypothetical protein
LAGAGIHNLIRNAASTGARVIFASTELDEIVDLANTGPPRAFSASATSARSSPPPLSSASSRVGSTLIIATVTDMLPLVGASTRMQILVKSLIVTMVVVLIHLSRRERRSPCA